MIRSHGSHRSFRFTTSVLCFRLSPASSPTEKPLYNRSPVQILSGSVHDSKMTLQVMIMESNAATLGEVSTGNLPQYVELVGKFGLPLPRASDSKSALCSYQIK
ncbi:hypothetical protein MPTK1_5g18510 [Marchantia polymorpha subsp. ruderalis]|uniref:Uncharacterized protein n=2 Tax=Marchantia polymorpha TaxID=3197 RepID=A0AAF6BJR6_MARPO|nr:hypothetical protein MARPO_0073s0089 [Marchantia polymorpha]BBN12250.1 hypothetical protein Mp_5g18510 [Marchantia polymorpha subsp. ruderalis]|eukprot:PTQ35225.1 hypothetical protein MARPO_0073s0089 [Marchantia polymorpha]